MIDWTRLREHKGKAALSFSGGKDSTLLAWMLREEGLLGKVTVYFADTGDLFPEMLDHVSEVESWCPAFVTVKTDAPAWARIHGEPSDLVPYSAHPIGQIRGDGARIARRFDCCAANLMAPLHQRIVEDGVTLLIRGTRRSDQPRLPVESGRVVEGIEHFYPIQEWTDADVFAFAKKYDVSLCSFYEHFRQGPECATCPAWWGVDNGPYLKANHPALFDIYQERVSRVMREIVPVMRDMQTMLNSVREDAL